MKLILLFIFFATKLTAQDSLIISGIEAPLPSFSKKFSVDDVQASTDKNDPSTIKINIKGEAKNVSFPIKLPFKAEATNPSNTNPLSQAEPSAAVAIEDKDGGVYEVDDKGKTKKIGNKGSELPPAEYKEVARKMNVRLGRATTPKLMFKALASEPLAFDEWQENFKGKNIIEKEYQKIGNDYYVPIKFIPQGMTGKVQVDLNGINKDSVIFKTPNGSIYTLQENNILSIAGAKNGDGIELYAQNKFDSTIIYGKLNIYGYEIKNLKVNLVPVNSDAKIDVDVLQNELNKIYYPYGVSVILNVLNKIEDKSWDLNNDGKLNTGDGEFLSRYTDEMSALNYILKTRTDFDKEAIYLFLLDAATGSNTKGDMPIKSQFGYIFKPTSQVISHEIAHGFFQLKHTFDDGIALQKNTTTNLMDYNDGDKLYKFQWDLVHDRGLKLFSFLQDSAGRKWGSKYGIYIHQLANLIAIMNKLNLTEYIKGISLIDLVSYIKEPNKLWKIIEVKYQKLLTQISFNVRVLNILNSSTTFSDEAQFQTGEYSYRHSMRNLTDKIEQAKDRTFEFVKMQFLKARGLQKNGQIDSAYFEFGIALHTIQDATSPAHAGFQIWTGDESLVEEIQHVNKEILYPGFESELQRVTNKYLSWFENINEPIPLTNLFNEIGYDK